MTSLQHVLEEYLLSIQFHLFWNPPGQKAGIFALPENRISSDEADHDEGDGDGAGDGDDEGDDMCAQQ